MALITNEKPAKRPKPENKEKEFGEMVKWLVGVGLLGGFILFMFLPIHDPLPIPQELTSQLIQAKQKWQKQAANSHYRLELSQDNTPPGGMLKVEVQNEQVINVFEVFKVLPQTLPIPKPINKTNATVSNLFDLAEKRINFYVEDLAAYDCDNISTVPVITYDPKLGYPTMIAAKWIDKRPNIIKLVGPSCSLPNMPLYPERHSGDLTITVIPLN